MCNLQSGYKKSDIYTVLSLFYEAKKIIFNRSSIQAIYI